MFSANGEVPWHKLGVIVDEEVVDAAAAMELSGLDWLVEKVPIHFEQPEPYERFAMVPQHFATVRNDRFGSEAALGVVGPHYTVVQNRELFEFADALLRTGAAKYETAGSLAGGRRVWCLAKFPEHVVSVADQDPIGLHLLIWNAHDGGESFCAAVVGIRVVCNNTLDFAMAGAQRVWRLRHTGSIHDRMEEATQALDLAFDYERAFATELRALVARRISSVEFERVLAHVRPVGDDGDVSVRMQRDRDDIATAYRSADTCNMPGIVGTRYAALQAVTLWADHGWRVARSSGGSALENRLRRTWWGSAHYLKQQAFDLLRRDEVPQVEVKVRAG